MSDLLKGNFTPKKHVTKSSTPEDGESLEQKLKQAALNSIGGSMVYVERTSLTWEGDAE